jgi:hypothetical protein
MTTTELDALEALTDAASEGPWEFEQADGAGDFYVSGPHATVICAAEDEDGELADVDVAERVRADMAFIAASRSAMPKLIKALRQQGHAKR